jgi:23S rRNA (guanine1835-N2)-methyltransferase
MFDVKSLLLQVQERTKPPYLILHGSPGLSGEILRCLPDGSATCFQFDLHQAAKLESILQDTGLTAKVVTLPDPWDLTEKFETVIYPVLQRGERELKLDLLEQSVQVLNVGGMLVSLSEYEADQLLPKLHKKHFGRCSELPASKIGSVFWSVKEHELPKRRHEMIFHARLPNQPSHEFVSRPGVFGYGKFDNGARALIEAAEIKPGDRILDLGCGVGAVGILAADLAGPEGIIHFADSSLRAISIAEANARSNGVNHFELHATADGEGLPKGQFDVILANPPYYANSSIAHRFIDISIPLLKPGGKIYLVTKQITQVGEYMLTQYPDTIAIPLRGYGVLRGTLGGVPEE